MACIKKAGLPVLVFLLALLLSVGNPTPALAVSAFDLSAINYSFDFSSVAWNNDSKTLTLTDAVTVVSASDVTFTLPAGATVVLKGENVINGNFILKGDTTITGSGSLYLTDTNKTTVTGSILTADGVNASLTLDGCSIVAAKAVSNGTLSNTASSLFSNRLVLQNGAKLGAGTANISGIGSVQWNSIEVKDTSVLYVMDPLSTSGTCTIFTNLLTMQAGAEIFVWDSVSGYSGADFSGIEDYLPKGFRIFSEAGSDTRILDASQSIAKSFMLHTHTYQPTVIDENDHYEFCTYCKHQTLSEAHAFGSTWTSDANGHRQSCSVCGYTQESTAHTPQTVNARSATDTADGYTGDTVCAVCGYLIRAGETVARSSQSGDDAELPQTGDSGRPELWLALLVLACAGLFLAARRAKRRSA